MKVLNTNVIGGFRKIQICATPLALLCLLNLGNCNCGSDPIDPNNNFQDLMNGNYFIYEKIGKVPLEIILDSVMVAIEAKYDSSFIFSFFDGLDINYYLKFGSYHFKDIPGYNPINIYLCYPIKDNPVVWAKHTSFNTEVIWANPVFYYTSPTTGDKFPLYMDNKVVVVLKDGTKENVLVNLSNKYPLLINDKVDFIHILILRNTYEYNTLEISAKLFETGHFTMATPNTFTPFQWR